MCLNSKPLPPIEVLNDLLHYDPDTGILSYKVSGKEAGYKTRQGHRRVKIAGESYQAHRVIWKMVYGEDPEQGKVMDHINRVKDDNRICNLRVVSVFENNINGGVCVPGATGINYITWVEHKKHYVVRVKRKYIKACKTLEEAKDVLYRYNDDDMLQIVTMP
jgi:hypothetical protein